MSLCAEIVCLLCLNEGKVIYKSIYLISQVIMRIVVRIKKLHELVHLQTNEELHALVIWTKGGHTHFERIGIA